MQDSVPSDLTLAGLEADVPVAVLVDSADCRMCCRKASQNARTCAASRPNARSSASAC